MSEAVEIPMAWCRAGSGLVGIAAVVLGLLSVAAPTRSIRLYQWIMARCNWRVRPIDEARELRNTQLLGTLLMLLGVFLLWHLKQEGTLTNGVQ